MSLPSFEVTLEPSAASRQLLLTAALLSLPAGAGLLCLLPWPWPWRLAAAAAWCGLQGRACRVFRDECRALRRLRLLPGQPPAALFEDGLWRRVVISPGSCCSARYAWLRLAAADGKRACLLVTRGELAAATWRRLRARLRLPP